MPERDVNDLSRCSSRQPVLQTDVTTSLTSFPDPNAATSPTIQSINEPLQGLLDDTGPSMFDEQGPTTGNPQNLSAASVEVIQGIIDHRGAVELVRQLSTLLAERDAHVTALMRLAEEYNVPHDRIVDTAKRVKHGEQRRLSLAKAVEDQVPTVTSESSDSNNADVQPGPNGTIRGFTKLFVGARRPRENGHSASSIHSHASSRSASVATTKKDRPQSVDVQSITSVESSSWTSALFGGGSVKSSSNNKPRRNSRSIREPVEMSTRRDKDQLPPTLSQTSNSLKDPQEIEWNRFLLRLMRSREHSSPHHHHQSNSSDPETTRPTAPEESTELIGASQFGNEGSAGRQKMEMLTRLVVGGIPMRLRHSIWMELSNTHAIVQPEAYEAFLSLSSSSSQEEGAGAAAGGGGGGATEDTDFSREIDAILKDVPRTLTSKHDFYADKGYDRLKRVLIAFVSKYPGLGYTQGLNMIAGYLLLAIPDESDAFWMLCNMVDVYFPVDYFSKESSMSAPVADNLVLRDYLRELLPRLAEKLDNEFDVDPAHTVPLSWFLTAFAGVLPEQALLRVWDIWLCLPHQKTFLFNVALTLLSQHAKGLIECESQGEYFAYMSGKCKLSEEPEKIGEFVKQAFVMRKKLEQLEIRRALAMSKLKKHPSTDGLYAPEPEGERQDESG